LNAYKLEVDENDEFLRNPEFVHQVGKVKDALSNEEYWYLKPTILKSETFKLLDLNYGPKIEFLNISIDEMKDLLLELSKGFNQLDITKRFMEIEQSNYDSSERIYNEAKEFLNFNHYYFQLDTLYETMVEKYPWCQSFEITKLELQRV